MSPAQSVTYCVLYLACLGSVCGPSGKSEIRGFVQDYLASLTSASDQLELNIRAIANSDCGALRFGSICSGMGTAEMVISVLQDVWREQHVVEFKAGHMGSNLWMVVSQGFVFIFNLILWSSTRPGPRVVVLGRWTASSWSRLTRRSGSS